MKTFTAFLTLAILAFTALVSAATDYENAVKCGKRFPKVSQAIEKFCSKQKDGKLTNDLVVPSEYAKKGVHTIGLKGKKILVNILGDCAPAQWVPYNWCNAQFNDLCANSVTGYNWRRHGKDDCQWFGISER